MSAAIAELPDTVCSLSSTPSFDRNAMQIRTYVKAVLAAGATAVAIAAAPTAAADGAQQSCTNLSSSATKCESPGDAEMGSP